jgi:hypothetical protein
MALTELQLPTKAAFYGTMQSAASKMNNLMKQWEDLAEFIGFVGTADLDAMGVATGQVRTDLTAFRTVMNELVAFFKGTSTTQTEIPADVVDKIRSM